MPMINLQLEPEDHVLPCPFCGGTSLVLFDVGTSATVYRVSCDGCHGAASGAIFYGYALSIHVEAKASALAAWNRRTPEAREAQARLERATSAALGVGIPPVEICEAVGAIAREHVYDAAQCGVEPHKAEAIVYELIIATAEAARPAKP